MATFANGRSKADADQGVKALRMQLRQKQGREAEPSAGIIDSQSIKTSAVRGPEKGARYGEKKSGAANGTCW